ncbi:MAG: GTPase ObgE [Parachlamydiales bacterium]|nr:GTPase ObgE [Parachlamydiales bacterium]
MFKDKMILKFAAGKGGDGIIAWKREKYLPKGGPYGGCGGYGGSIILEVDEHLISLEKFFYKKKIKAENAQPGGANNKTGRNGQDLIIKVPLGTIIKENGNILFEFTQKDQKFLLCKGGKPGKGNYYYRSSTNQAPNICTMGEDGEEKEIELDLKIIADIGLVGFPNAGKSTLMSKLTNNKVKIASYPFTTLFPNIGKIQFEDFSYAFLADIPGIIKDAHLNKGLGLNFLKHIERTSILLFVIDLSAEDPINDFEILENEINSFNPEILKKPKIIALNKIDLSDTQENIKTFKKAFPTYKNSILEISADQSVNLDLLLNSLFSILNSSSLEKRKVESCINS